MTGGQLMSVIMRKNDSLASGIEPEVPLQIRFGETVQHGNRD